MSGEREEAATTCTVAWWCMMHNHVQTDEPFDGEDCPVRHVKGANHHRRCTWVALTPAAAGNGSSPTPEADHER
jgi:hypothetical protein